MEGRPGAPIANLFGFRPACSDMRLWMVPDTRPPDSSRNINPAQLRSPVARLGRYRLQGVETGIGEFGDDAAARGSQFTRSVDQLYLMLQ
jgi:hypothetical protein